MRLNLLFLNVLLVVIPIACAQCDSRSRVLIESEWSGKIASSTSKYLQQYHKNQECEWYIKAPTGGRYISLTFSEFETECMFDYVSVYDGINEGTRRKLGSLSGDRSPLEIVSDTGHMYVHLLSDADKVLRGFAATFNVYVCPSNCSNHGRCNSESGSCTCEAGWYGAGCGEKLIECGKQHGTLDTELNKCICGSKHFGTKCEIPIVEDVEADAVPFNKRFSVSSGQSRIGKLKWNQSKGMLPRQGHTAHVIGDHLYVLGGYDLNQIMDSFKRYQILTDIWEDVPVSSKCRAVPKGRYLHQSVVYNDTFIVSCGGYYQGTADMTKECWVFDVEAKCWERYPDLPHPIVGHSMVLVNDFYLYVYGGITGYNTGNYSCKIHRSDVRRPEKGWEEVIPRIGRCSELRRSAHSAVFHAPSQNMIVFGGLMPGYPFYNVRRNDTLLFNVKTNVWSKLKHPRSINAPQYGIAYHKAVIVGRFMIISGGNINITEVFAQCYNDELLLFDLECMDWSTVPYQRSILRKGDSLKNWVRYAHAATVYKGYMLVVGGFNGKPLNDILAYRPPNSNCSDIPYTQCKHMVHCVRCNKKCKHVDECPSRISQCSVCYKLLTCTECALAGCQWCVEDGGCSAVGSAGLCGVMNPVPWWGDKGTLLTTAKQCRELDMPPGFHWIKYADPIYKHQPDSVEIIRSANVELFYRKQAKEKIDISQRRKYYGTIKGFIKLNATKELRKDKRKYRIQMFFEDGITKLYTGSGPWSKVKRFNGTSRNVVEKSDKYPLPPLNLVYIEAEVSQFINENQKASKLKLVWDGDVKGRDEVLSADAVFPSGNGANCSHHISCLKCLTDIYCGWCESAETCINRSEVCSKNEPLLTTVAFCGTCQLHVTCHTCTQDKHCEWTFFRCNRKGRFPEAIKDSSSCPSPCSHATSCDTCTDINHQHCSWCKDLGKCLSFNTLLALYPFGMCSEWANSFNYYQSPQLEQYGVIPQCLSCEMAKTCFSCLEVQGCGWCARRDSPYKGKCIKGDYEFGDCEDGEDDSHDWYYNQCPFINECKLGIHKCHEFASCKDTLESYTCECIDGYDGDGMESCISACEKRCYRGKCNEFNQCECDMGFTGVDCDEDCACNSHSTCSTGRTICDKCEHLTEGMYCEHCMAGAYRKTDNPHAPCNPCNCNGHHDPNRGYCDKKTGVCHCTGHTVGNSCEFCEPGYYGNARDNGVCYMYARSRTHIEPVQDGALGNLKWERQYRSLESGHKTATWYLTPKDRGTEIVVHIDGYHTSDSNLPGTVYVWDGISPYLSSAKSHTSKLLLKLSPDLLTSRNAITGVNVLARDSVTILYEGMISTSFNISYKLRNCTYNCHNERYNGTCQEGSSCTCAKGFMGPLCSIPICPNDCNSRGRCMEGSGICKCNSSNSGISCNARSTPYVRWVLQSYDWVPTGQVVMPPRAGHATFVVLSGDRHVFLLTFGGYNLYHLFNDAWVFDVEKTSWMEMKYNRSSGNRRNKREVERPSPRYLTSNLQLEDSIIIIGGMTDTGISNEIWCLTFNSDTMTGEWKQVFTVGLPPLAGAAAAASTRTGDWYVFGGVSPDTDISNKLCRLRSNALLWETISPVRNIVPAMFGHSLSFYNDTLYAMGRRGMYRYSIRRNTWLSLASDWMFRSRHHAVATKDSILYVLGGKKYHNNGSTLVSNDVYAYHMITGSHNRLASPNIGHVYLSQLVQHNNKLYTVGGFNGSVHSSVESYDMQTSVCFMISEERRCQMFGCYWCGDVSLAPKPCLPYSLQGCERRDTLMGTNCSALNDFYSCTAYSSCSWVGSKRTCHRTAVPPSNSSNTDGGTMATKDTCQSHDTCSTCSEDLLCYWYGETCTAVDLVSAAMSICRTCPLQCHLIKDCVKCTVSPGCNWGRHSRKCLSADQADWQCLVDRCDLLVSPSQCPRPCSSQTTCTMCKEYPQCGWCGPSKVYLNNGTTRGSGYCTDGNVEGPLNGSCSINNSVVPWWYFTCPDENQCHLDIDTCREDQICLNIGSPYHCVCPFGFQESPDNDKCIPSCHKYGCVEGQGVCVETDTCTCAFGYYGNDCSKQCPCSGHSHCDIDGTCLDCKNNTDGDRCNRCRQGYVRDGNVCVPCFEVCNKATNICVSSNSKGNSTYGPSSRRETKCKDCKHDSDGEHCELCNLGFFRHPETGRCEACMCNGHSLDCNSDTGAGCHCENNTLSSCQSKNDDNCYLKQCNACVHGYQGDPRNSALCYKTLTENRLYVYQAKSQSIYPVHIKTSGLSPIFIYLKFERCCGVVEATLNPSHYTIVNDNLGGQQINPRILLHSDIGTHKDPAVTRGVPNEYPSSWIQDVKWMAADDLMGSYTVELNSLRKFIKFTPKAELHDIYLLLSVQTTSGVLSLAWYQETLSFNYYLFITFNINFTIIFIVIAYLIRRCAMTFRHVIRQGQYIVLKSNVHRISVAVKVDISLQKGDRLSSLEVSPTLSTVSTMGGGYSLPPHQTNDYPVVEPLAIQKLLYGPKLHRGLATVFIRRPGPNPDQVSLVLGSSIFESHPNSLSLKRKVQEQFYRETTI